MNPAFRTRLCVLDGVSSRSARDLNILFSFYASKNDITEHMPLGSILRTGGGREMGEEREGENI